MHLIIFLSRIFSQAELFSVPHQSGAFVMRTKWKFHGKYIFSMQISELSETVFAFLFDLPTVTMLFGV